MKTDQFCEAPRTTGIVADIACNVGDVIVPPTKCRLKAQAEHNGDG